MSLTATAIRWTEQGVVPDGIVRAGIRRLLRERLAEIGGADAEAAAEAAERFIAQMDAAPIALVPEKANAQHYEVPAEFFELVLGAHRKYSACHFTDPSMPLDEAEARALAITCERAGLADGQQVLELGCGWGSLTLWMAARYPAGRFTALSNSHGQRRFIEGELARRGLSNVEVITCDINRFDTGRRFDRVVSVEMFEHLRNWRRAFAQVRRWLEPDGRFLMHVFVHRDAPYAFEPRDATDWMSEHFFSGGMMPGDGLAARFQDDLRLLRSWRWNGRHYAWTAEAWLRNLDARRDRVWPILERTYGAAQAGVWWSRWRLFFLSCAELFGYDDGERWWVSHYLWEPRR